MEPSAESFPRVGVVRVRTRAHRRCRDRSDLAPRRAPALGQPSSTSHRLRQALGERVAESAHGDVQRTSSAMLQIRIAMSIGLLM
jgi:hypothetical protein